MNSRRNILQYSDLRYHRQVRGKTQLFDEMAKWRKFAQKRVFLLSTRIFPPAMLLVVPSYHLHPLYREKVPAL